MGKASKWFRGLLGLKKSSSSSEKPPPPSSTPPATTTKEKRRWSFVKSYREKDPHHHHHHNKNDTATSQNDTSAISSNDDPNKHAIAVAAATAAVADAAVAAAQAAAAVVRLTSSGRCVNNPAAYGRGGSTTVGIREEEWAAVKIQAAFRGCLARRALRALKGLVRLQALVRGHIERKKTAERWQQLHAVLRAQARARAGRTLSELSQSSSKSSHFHQPGPATPEKFEHAVRSKIKHEQSLMLRRNSSKANGRIISDHDKVQWDERSWDYPGSSLKNGTTDDEKNDRVLEIDSGKPHIASKRRNLFHSSHLSLPSDQNSYSFTTSKDSTIHQTLPSPSSCEVQSLTPLKFSREVEEDSYCTANSSPQFYSASSKGATSKRSPFTPTKSDGSRSHLSGYSDYPSYMACTESSKAKLRSLSAPKQRPQYERSSSAKRYSVHGFGELRSSAQRASALHANFASKAYPGSGRLDKLGMPVGYRY